MQSYYGSLEPIKPKHTVVHMILDDYIKQSVEKVSEEMKAQLTQVIKHFKDETIVKLMKEIKVLHEYNHYLYKCIKKLADKNGVRLSEYDSIVQGTQKKMKKKEKKDDGG